MIGRPGIPNPSTDDLIQWGAHKWGIPENWLKAEYWGTESGYEMSHLGDARKYSQESAETRSKESESAWYYAYPPQARIEPPPNAKVWQSMGISQIKWKPNNTQWPGTEPLRWKSTAFNIDFQASTLRYYYDGLCSWCKNAPSSGYGSGQEWNSIGAWFEPWPWGNAGQEGYVARVQKALVEHKWPMPAEVVP